MHVGENGKNRDSIKREEGEDFCHGLGFERLKETTEGVGEKVD